MSVRFSRRGFLAGAGASLILPSLEIFSKSDTAYANQVSQPLFVGVFLANGVVSSDWRSSGTETDWLLGDDLQNLAPNKANITVLQGLENRAGKESQSLNGDASHWVAATSFLTGSHYDFSAGPQNNLRLDSLDGSIDQRIAAADGSPLSSLVMGLQEIDYGPNGDDRGNLGYLTRTSWISPDAQASRASTSADVFRAVFGVDPGGAAPVDPGVDGLTSVLDKVLEQRDRFTQSLGGADKQRMEKYFDSIRGLEQSIADERRRALIACDQVSGDFEASTSLSLINQRATNMARLAATALSCGVTRVVSHMFANEHNYGPSDAMAGVTDNGTIVQHHSASHYDFEGSRPMAKAFVAWQIGLFNQLLNELSAANVLDDSIVLFGSGMGDSQYHSFDDLPLILAGRGCGKLHPGRLLQRSDNLADLLFTLLRHAGVDATSQAGSSRMLSYL